MIAIRKGGTVVRPEEGFCGVDRGTAKEIQIPDQAERRFRAAR